MPRLTANYSDALVELIRSDDAPIDGIEVGPWFTPKEIRHFVLELPEWQFQFHASSFISRVRYWPGAITQLREYLKCTQSQWVSVHIELLPLHVYLLSSLYGLHLNPPENTRMIDKLIHALKRIREAVEIPIILENLPSLPVEKYAYAANPDIIANLVETTDSGFLLDIAHARAAASFQGENINSYLDKLPLEQIKQVHVSGVRMQEGYLRDAHEPMQVEDYAILNWVLERSNPMAVTLEYFRERELLRKQLWQLREIIAG